MPNGFFGPAARQYLTLAAKAHGDSTESVQQAREGVPPDPRDRHLRARHLPFERGAGSSGAFSTGWGNSNNIVVSQGEYDKIMGDMDRVDYAMGECIYKTATEIETLCETIFHLPRVAPQCKNISQTVKGLLNEYVALTDELRIQTRKFAQEMVEIE